ncbi:hypothetical protein C815_01995 [Firmicutes bacterium M10-2]|nr:hypothetical protein C815_01995 [Firmicutes bacterium M10-2]
MHFSINVPEKEFDEFASHHEYCNLLQSAKWREVKNNWDSLLTGVYDDNNQLMMVGLVLIKKLPLGLSLFYIPRGPVCDFSDKELVSFYFKELRKLARKYRAVLIKFDPSSYYHRYQLSKGEDETDMNKLQGLFDLDSADYLGRTTDMYATAQPRFHMGVEYTPTWKKDLPRVCLKSQRAAIRKGCQIEILSGDQIDTPKGKELMDRFAFLMNETGDRKGIHLRDESYFEKMCHVYKDHCHIFFVKVDVSKMRFDLQKRLDELNAQLETSKSPRKLKQEIDTVSKDLDEFKKLEEKYHGVQYIAGCLQIEFGKYVELIYAGMNEDFRKFHPYYHLYLSEFEWCFDHGYPYATLGGVEGTLEGPLANFKKQFDPIVTEFVGEFDMKTFPVVSKLAIAKYRQLRQAQHDE